MKRAPPFRPSILARPRPRSAPGRLVGAIAAAALLALALAGTGIAEDAEEPLRLIPSQQDEAADDTGPAPGEGAPARIADPTADAEGGGISEAPAAALDEGGIVVGTLEAIDPDAAGLLVPGIEPFPADLWSGSRRSRIEALLPRLPALARSATMRRLALALLASEAEPPAGAGAAGALVLARAERLAAMGERGLALALLERARPPGGEEAIARLRTDRMLAALDYDGACAGIANNANRSGDGYWRRLRILCQAEAGLIEAATLGLDLLQESGAAPDSLFDDTIYAMAGLAEPTPERLDEATPLHVAAWRLAQIPIPAEATVSAPPDVLPAIVGAPESSPATRLRAAEHAWASGVLSAETLRELYRQMPFTPEERADPLAHIAGLEPVLAGALLLQAIEAQSVPALRAELLGAALSYAAAEGVLGSEARMLAHPVRSLPPAPEHVWLSGAAGRALIAAGDRDAAAAWYGLARERAPSDAGAAQGASRLWPLMLLSEDEPHLGAAAFEAWRAALAQDDDSADASRAIARQNWLVVLLDALGARIDHEVWDRLLADGRSVAAPAPAPALVRGLRVAADEGRLGETVLMALLLLGDGGPAMAGYGAVGPVVAGLVSLGLEEEARALALEAALAAGL